VLCISGDKTMRIDLRTDAVLTPEKFFIRVVIVTARGFEIWNIVDFSELCSFSLVLAVYLCQLCASLDLALLKRERYNSCLALSIELEGYIISVSMFEFFR
jgi:hypothetical protein